MNGILLTLIILGVIGVLSGLLLSVVSIVMAVKKDEKLEKLENALPGANCGGCGFSGCSAYAEALYSGKTEDMALCSVAGADGAKAIAEIMGKEAGEFIKKVAVVRCRGNWDFTHTKMDYEGYNTCSAANQLFKGLGACAHGCMGFGDCAAVCPENAIIVENGLARVDHDKCIACGKCVKTCPKSIIRLVPYNETTRFVSCVNREKGALVRKQCTAGCLGCGLCVKKCEHGAITLYNKKAKIDYSKCTGCGACQEACPAKCILDFNG